MRVGGLRYWIRYVPSTMFLVYPCTRTLPASQLGSSRSTCSSIRSVCHETGICMLLTLCVQSQALQWCVEREYPVLPKQESDKPVQFWQYRVGTKVAIMRLDCSRNIADLIGLSSHTITTVRRGSMIARYAVDQAL